MIVKCLLWLNTQGVNVLMELCSSHQLVNMPPVIAMTGNASAQDRQMYCSAGFMGTLPKPFSTEDLSKMLTQIVNKQKPT